MSLIRTLHRGFRGLFRKAAVEGELNDELRHYVAMATQERIAMGMAPEAAARAARLEVSSEHAKEVVRGGLWESTVEAFWRDLRYGARRLIRSPGFTGAAVVSLALGIGANTAIFSLVEHTLLRKLPVTRPEELYYVRSGTASGVFSYPDFAELREQNRPLQLAAWGGISASISTSDQPDLVSGVIVTGNFFPLLGVQAQKGRMLGLDDDKVPGAHPVAVISHGFWQRRFGGTADIVGRNVLLNGHPFTIVGVAPAGFEGPQLGVQRDLYVPMMMQAMMRPPRSGYSGEMNPDLLQKRTNRWLNGIGRLPLTTSPAQALAALNNSLKQLQATTPDQQRNTSATISPVNDGDAVQRKQMVSVALLLMAVVGAVLLIACANVANLLLARAATRKREIAVRLSIGATRGRLIRQLLIESTLLAVVGGLAGVGLAQLAVGALRASPPPNGALPITSGFAINGRVLAFTALLSVVTGLVFGLMPALRASRPDLVPALKDETSPTIGRWRRISARNVLVVGQVALSLVLLIAAGLFLRSVQLTQALSPGFDVNKLLTAPLSVNLLRYTTADGQRFYREVVDRVNALPGVESATLARWVPLTGGSRVTNFQVEGRVGPADASSGEGGGQIASDANTVNANVVGGDYFRTLGIRLVGGRDFSVADAGGAPRVVIVNDGFARKQFPGQNAIGRRLSINGSTGPWLEIVGIAADSKLFTISEAAAPILYLPLAQNHETGMTLIVRGAGEPASLIAPVSREIHALEKSLPLAGMRPMKDWLSIALYPARAGTVLLGVFGALALLLAAVGLAGVMSYGVARRTRELGLRMALGARSADVLLQVVRDGMLLVIAGIVLGVIAAIGVTRLLASFLTGVSTLDTLTFVAVPCVLVVVALGACVVPARRVLRVDPMVALRGS